MQTQTTPSTNSKDEYWSSVMKQYESSGLSQKQFCEQNNISYGTFKTHRYQSSAICQNKKNKPVKSCFEKVSLKHEQVKFLKLVHPSGIECTIPSTLSDQMVLSLVKGLRTC